MQICLQNFKNVLTFCTEPPWRSSWSRWRPRRGPSCARGKGCLPGKSASRRLGRRCRISPSTIWKLDLLKILAKVFKIRCVSVVHILYDQNNLSVYDKSWVHYLDPMKEAYVIFIKISTMHIKFEVNCFLPNLHSWKFWPLNMSKQPNSNTVWIVLYIVK